MKAISKLILPLILTLSSVSFAKDEGRRFGLYFGGGLGRSLSVLEASTFKSYFEGSFPGVEVGIDMPWSPESGVSLSGSFNQHDLTNNSSDRSFIEKISGSETAGKLGIYYSRLAFGGGISQQNLTARQVSETSGRSETEIRGQTSMYFLSLNLSIKTSYRVTFEFAHHTGNIDHYKFSNTTGAMKFFFLLDL